MPEIFNIYHGALGGREAFVGYVEANTAQEALEAHRAKYDPLHRSALVAYAMRVDPHGTDGPRVMREQAEAFARQFSPDRAS